MQKHSPSNLELMIVTGSSGAGKTMALRYLEDLGYFCADNIVPALLVSFVDLLNTQFQKVAVVIDSRGGSFFDALSGCLHTLKENGFDYKILFLEASDEILVRRFSETRRRHPLQKEEMSLLESIKMEREWLKEIREQANLILNTSYMKSAELKEAIQQQVVSKTPAQQGMVVTLTSFGYRYGVPMDADLIFDVRFLPNPFYQEQLKALTGLEKPVRDFVMGRGETHSFLAYLMPLLRHLLPSYQREGKSNLNLAIGCTGGRHRSVAMIHHLAKTLQKEGFYILEKHRDVSKDNERYQEKRKKNSSRDLSLVTLGGGTGLSTVLRGFKRSFGDISAIVTVSDDGGSSGRLRKEMGILPPGDIRNCLTALADEEDLMTALFDYRFRKGKGGLGGHSFGNLFLTAMAEVVGDFKQAITHSGEVLAIHGKVLPASLDQVHLRAQMKDGACIEGESAITDYNGRISSVGLIGENLSVLPESLEAIREADAIILGPGSLYTSVIPHLLFPEMVQAIMQHKGPKIYICNIMSQPGETTDMGVSDYIESLYQHAGQRDWLDFVLVNEELPSSEQLQKYAEDHAFPVRIDRENIQDQNLKVVTGQFLAKGNLIRHNPEALAQTLSSLLNQWFFPGLETQ